MPELKFQLNDETQAICACVDAFEQSDPTTQSELRDFVKDVPEPFKAIALGELARVDFERKWQAGSPRRVADYVRDYPELQASGEPLLELCRDEYELRMQAGETPTLEEYRRIEPRFSPRSTRVESKAAHPTEVYRTGDVQLAPPEAAAPERLGNYKIVSQLGSGSFGAVYEAFDEVLGRRVAIKLQHPERGQRGLVNDMLNEAQAVAAIDHPGIVKLIHRGETAEGRSYLVYEFIDGATLENRIQRNDYKIEDAVEWIAQCAEALEVAHNNHGHRIYHRDLKPANILINKSGKAKLVDFGMARKDGQFFTDENNRYIGTAVYFSPEQAAKRPQWASPQSDLFSLGIVLFEMLCKQRPFESKSLEELLEQVRERTPISPRSLNAEITPALEDVCFKALAKNPADRFRTGGDMAKALRKSIARKPSPVAKFIPLTKVVAAIAAIAAVCVIVVDMRNSKSQGESKSIVPLAPPTFTAATLELRRGDEESKEWLDDHLPLRTGDELVVQATLDQRAYGYVIAYELNGPARLLYPSRAELSSHPASDRIVTELPDDLLPAGKGALLIVSLANSTPLKETDIDALLATRLTADIADQTASESESRITIAEPAPDFPHNTKLRGTRPRSLEKVLLTDESFKKFKSNLHARVPAYHGMILPFQTKPPAQEEQP